MSSFMKAAQFVEPGTIVIGEKPIPEVGSGDALVRITTTTICGTDVHISTAGARLRGATMIIGVDTVTERIKIAITP